MHAVYTHNVFLGVTTLSGSESGWARQTQSHICGYDLLK